MLQGLVTMLESIPIEDIQKVTVAAAESVIDLHGSMEKNLIDGAAVNAMRNALYQIAIAGKVVIGEGQKDKAPMLKNGEKVGNGLGIAVDIAIDPIDGTSLVAKGKDGAVSLIAFSPSNTMFNPEDNFYMYKLVTGHEASSKISITRPLVENLHIIAEAKSKKINDLVVNVLRRPRHEKLALELQALGIKVRFFDDGDVTAALVTCLPHTEVDAMIGIGGSPEAIIAAAGIIALGGNIQTQLVSKTHIESFTQDPLTALNLPVLTKYDLIHSNNVLLSITGVSDNDLVKGLKREGNKIVSDTLIIGRLNNGPLMIHI
jgi:fructose-1,6-bisphosphatase II